VAAAEPLATFALTKPLISRSVISIYHRQRPSRDCNERIGDERAFAILDSRWTGWMAEAVELHNRDD